jgi:hypothetical protein
MKPLACVFCALFLAVSCERMCASEPVRAADYSTLHEAIEKNPGRVIDVGPDDWTIDRRLTLSIDRAGLRGTGRIIQTNPTEPILEVIGATDVVIRDLTFTRAPGKEDSEAAGVLARKCRYLRLADITVLDNRSRSPAIGLDECFAASITGCTVRNYMRVAVDDRTEKPQYYGFAFLCIDGTGISVRASEGTLSPARAAASARPATAATWPRRPRILSITSSRRCPCGSG